MSRVRRASRLFKGVSRRQNERLAQRKTFSVPNGRQHFVSDYDCEHCAPGFPVGCANCGGLVHLENGAPTANRVCDGCGQDFAY